MRLFVTIKAPEAWRDAATAQQLALFDALPEDAQDAIRIVKTELMHVTLRFLGEVDEGAVDPLQAALDAVEAPEIPLTLDRAGTFGQPAPIWAVYLGIAGDLDALGALAARVDGAVGLLGLPPEARPFSAHLTLARVQRRASAEARRAIADVVRDLDAPPPLPYVVRGIVLVRSYLEDPTPRYEVLSRHP